MEFSLLLPKCECDLKVRLAGGAGGGHDSRSGSWVNQLWTLQSSSSEAIIDPTEQVSHCKEIPNFLINHSANGGLSNI